MSPNGSDQVARVLELPFKTLYTKFLIIIYLVLFYPVYICNLRFFDLAAKILANVNIIIK